MSEGKYAIGIDLGTTYSKVAAVRNGEVVIIPNAEGNRTTPSIVCFHNNEILVGDLAKKEITMRPEKCVYDVKRIIGRRFHDPSVQEDSKKWPFKVINSNLKAMIKVGDNTYSPEQISSKVLNKMKSSAEDYCRHAVKDVVITVPAAFSNDQREATIEAAKLAGLNVLQLMVEPTAAALAHGINSKSSKMRHALVFDFGGGTFDVSVLEITGSEYRVLSTRGKAHLGGIDIDANLADLFIKVFQNKNKTVITDEKTRRRIMRQCESAKIRLSMSDDASIDVPDINNVDDTVFPITRARFEGLNEDIFDQLTEILSKTLSDTIIRKEDINDIVVVGGSSHIPKVKKILNDFFKGKKPHMGMEEEAVVRGAAFQAAILTKQHSFDNIKLFDVLPLSIGIKDQNGRFVRIIRRNTHVQKEESRLFETWVDNQLDATFPIYEGDGQTARENSYLGKLIITGLPPKPAGKVMFRVVFYVDRNGILDARVEEESSGQTKGVKLQIQKSRSTI